MFAVVIVIDKFKTGSCFTIIIRNCTLPLANAEETTVQIENKFMSSHISGKIPFKLPPWWWVVCLLPTIQLDPEYNPIRGFHAKNLQTRYFKFFGLIFSPDNESFNQIKS